MAVVAQIGTLPALKMRYLPLIFGLNKVHRYDNPKIDERTLVDCVVCFDVLEHIFVSDVATVLRDFFTCKKLVILNVACYEANALLPNGENAHITVLVPLVERSAGSNFC